MSRKLDNHHENPIDNLIYYIVEFLDPYFYKLNFTPNIIFTLASCLPLNLAVFYIKIITYVYLYI